MRIFFSCSFEVELRVLLNGALYLCRDIHLTCVNIRAAGVDEDRARDRWAWCAFLPRGSAGLPVTRQREHDSKKRKIFNLMSVSRTKCYRLHLTESYSFSFSHSLMFSCLKCYSSLTASVILSIFICRSVIIWNRFSRKSMNKMNINF